MEGATHVTATVSGKTAARAPALFRNASGACGERSTARQRSTTYFELLICSLPILRLCSACAYRQPRNHHVVRRADTHYCGAKGRWVAKLTTVKTNS